MALLSASDFTGYSDSYAAPAGFNDPIFAGSVDLLLSTRITQQVLIVFLLQKKHPLHGS